MTDKHLEAFVPAAIKMLNDKKELPVKDFERTFGTRMVEELTRRGIAKIVEITMCDRSNRVPDYQLKVIRPTGKR